RITAQQIAAMAARNHGTASLKTVEGENLMFRKSGGGWWVIDAKGGKARITIPNVMQSNGVIHVVDTVLMPE
ncbi:MAG TPA: fasciclin domain-containing protein, partial [Sphingomicrobium sp.]|nr:fasciclin domain-containing protein [Sphingomicrobium sp.]